MSKKKADKRKLVCSYGSKVMHSGLSLDRVPKDYRGDVEGYLQVGDAELGRRVKKIIAVDRRNINDVLEKIKEAVQRSK